MHTKHVITPQAAAHFSSNGGIPNFVLWPGSTLPAENAEETACQGCNANIERGLAEDPRAVVKAIAPYTVAAASAGTACGRS